RIFQQQLLYPCFSRRSGCITTGIPAKSRRQPSAVTSPAGQISTRGSAHVEKTPSELSQKYKSPSQNWNFLFAFRGKVIVVILHLTASSYEGRMDQIAKKRIMVVGR